MISEHIAQVLTRIEAICRRIGRNSSEITLVGVTKFADPTQIQTAIEAGLNNIGENKVQEAHRKFPLLNPGEAPLIKHFIGHLQTNKVKQALELFDIIESVDSLKMVNAIEAQSANLNKTTDILLQVNTSGEEQKYGLNPVDVVSVIEEILSLKYVRVLGLMAIAPMIDHQEVVRTCFRDLRCIFEDVKTQYASQDNIQMKYLSMGMSSDFEIALEEGSNMIRIGRAIFQP